MSKSNYLGNIYDGRWKVIKIIYKNNDKKHQYYLLENIYNKTQITISPRAMRNISEGKTTIYNSIWVHNHRKGGNL